MRYLVTPDFTQKVIIAGLGADTLGVLSKFLKDVEQKSKAELLTQNALNLSSSGEELYLSALPAGLSVLFSFAEDKDGEHVLFLDLIVSAAAGSEAGFPKHPLAAATNPLKNVVLNPRHNAMLNPRHNAMINPRHNAMINPRHNAMINPRHNAMLNIRHNSALNPRYNYALNPKYNRSLDPKINRSLSGPFVYDLKEQVTGFLVRASDQLSLLYGSEKKLDGVAVSNGSEGMNLFDEKGEWIQYWVSTQKGGLLCFDLNGEWVGFVLTGFNAEGDH